MSPAVHVHLLPQLIPPGALDDGIAVVIDVLRASTTIVHALASGASEVIPCGTVEEARQAAAARPAGTVLLGGERRGERIDGFDLGNSPGEYTPDVVAGKTIVFTTTNGTKALLTCERSAAVLIGAFSNRAALLECLVGKEWPVHLVCAGTDGHLTAEDILFAGSVAESLGRPLGDVATELAVDFWRARSQSAMAIFETLRESRGGRNLIELGLGEDIARAAAENLFDLVPEWNADTNRIVAHSG